MPSPRHRRWTCSGPLRAPSSSPAGCSPSSGQLSPGSPRRAFRSRRGCRAPAHAARRAAATSRRPERSRAAALPGCERDPVRRARPEAPAARHAVHPAARGDAGALRRLHGPSAARARLLQRHLRGAPRDGRSALRPAGPVSRVPSIARIEGGRERGARPLSEQTQRCLGSAMGNPSSTSRSSPHPRQGRWCERSRAGSWRRGWEARPRRSAWQRPRSGAGSVRRLTSAPGSDGDCPGRAPRAGGAVHRVGQGSALPKGPHLRGIHRAAAGRRLPARIQGDGGCARRPGALAVADHAACARPGRDGRRSSRPPRGRPPRSRPPPARR